MEMNERMKNWRFVITSLIIVLGMTGSFIGATISYNKLLISFLDKSGVVALLAFELVWLIGFTVMLVLALIDTIKILKKDEKWRQS